MIRAPELSRLSGPALTAAALLFGCGTAHAQAQKPRLAAFMGSYVSRSGIVEIRPRDTTNVSVEISASEPQTARWTCEFRGAGRLQPNGTILAEDRSEAVPVRVRLALTGDRLSVKDVSSQPQRGYCGLNGSIDGVYRRKAVARKAR